jgi:hypothetical protein
MLLGRGLMHGDPAAAAEGANLSAQRRRPDLMWRAASWPSCATSQGWSPASSTPWPQQPGRRKPQNAEPARHSGSDRNETLTCENPPE